MHYLALILVICLALAVLLGAMRDRRRWPSLGNAGAIPPPEGVTTVNGAAAANAAANAALTVGDENWIDVAWVGEFPHPQGMTQVVDAEDLQTMLKNFQTAAANAGANWAGIPAYLGHPELTGKLAEAEAYAWFKAARIANGRLQMQADFTDVGAAALAGKRIKFLSPYWYYTRDAAGNAHPFWIGSVGFTNNPVLKGQRPLANAEGGEPPAGSAPDAVATPDAEPSLETQLAEILGVAANAAAIVDGVKQLVASATATGEAFNAFILDQAVKGGHVAANASASAAKLLAADRESAMAFIFAEKPGAAAGGAPPAPPKNPLAGVNLAAGNAATPKRPIDMDQVHAAANAQMTKTGCSWDQAHAWAWGLAEQGKLPNNNAA